MCSGQSSRLTKNYLNFLSFKCYVAMHDSSLLTSFSNSLKPALYCLTQAFNKNSQLNTIIGFLTKHNKRNMDDLKSKSQILTTFSWIQSFMGSIEHSMWTIYS